ncbi:MAG: hypothetical protein J1E07_00645 [Treponema sp.]|nr:hypothetical protein [Treponema sp.]
MTEFCIVEFKYRNSVFYAIWCTDEDDYFFTQDDALVCFPTWEATEKYCAEKNFGEPAFASFDFGGIDPKNCNDYLKKWNTIDDLARTLKIGFLGNENFCTDLYVKFVCSANIPALNTSGKNTVPR